MAILAEVTLPWAQLQEGIISLKFLLEPRLESESFKLLKSKIQKFVNLKWKSRYCCLVFFLTYMNMYFRFVFVAFVVL